MPIILAVSGSPSATSRTASAAEHALALLGVRGHAVSHVAVRDLPSDDLLSGFRDTPALWTATDAVAQADGVIIATPVYKASYTGLLKAFLDLLPEDAFAGKVVLPLVTGGTIGHLLTIDYALRPVLTALGADHVVQGRFLLDSDIVRGGGGGGGGGGGDGGGDGRTRLTLEAERRLAETVAAFAAALERRSVVSPELKLVAGAVR
ncbi:MAG: NADPH-dependent FMN reductase [Catenulispora sp.]|nr:NADPH-dependent FMN reductase [Catenulispora sp.]